jgi:hypothetical protein
MRLTTLKEVFEYTQELSPIGNNILWMVTKCFKNHCSIT